VNPRVEDIALVTLADGDLELGKFDGEEAIQALAVLDGVLLK
jgi:hypothetical protein